MSQQKLTLYQPMKYQIKVPGILNQNLLDWNGGMKSIIKSERDGVPITTLTITVDQAGLQGLLRHLYSLGLPLISVICVDCT
jgi:hypothetical protein